MSILGPPPPCQYVHAHTALRQAVIKRQVKTPVQRNLNWKSAMEWSSKLESRARCHLLQQQHGHIRSGSVEKPNGGLTPTPALLNLSVFFFTLQSTPPFSASLPSFGSQLLLCLPHMYYSHTTAGSNPSLVPLSVQLWLPDCEGSNTCLVFSAYNETVEARLKNSFMI